MTLSHPLTLADAAEAWQEIHGALGALYCLSTPSEDAPTREELNCLFGLLFEATKARSAALDLARDR